MDRLDILNAFVEKYNYEDFVEIGVFTGYTLDGCKAPNKIGVDPNLDHYKGTNQTFKGTSDEFFNSIPSNQVFDLIWIDGLHEAEQVSRDIENSLKHLDKGGMIVLHDCNPPQYEHTTTGIDGCWTGDTYKAILKYKKGKFNDALVVVNTDWGVGILPYSISVGESEKIVEKGFDEGIDSWEFFDQNRKDLLNLISVEEFKTREGI